MYNRYIPQADGSFRRSRVPEPTSNQPQRERSQQVRPEAERKEPPQSQSAFEPQPREVSHPQRGAHSTWNTPYHESPAPSVGSFLKGLLPQSFDTEDLMVVLLLLLMSGNSGKDQNAALMTLVIYLFL